MKRKANGYILECDFCGKLELVEDDSPDIPYGVQGQIMVHHGGGGYSFDFYSCHDDDEHVARAYKRANQRAMEEM